MKNKFLSKIIVSLVAFAVLLAPVSPVLKKQTSNSYIKIESRINKAQADETPPSTSTTITYTSNADGEKSFGCGLSPFSWFTNCIGLLIYSIIFVPISMITHVAARILDFFVYYSTNSGSYDSIFVQKGWAAVRDIANIFFIVALLYVAIKTILGLNVSDNKKLIGAVVIVALLINFSLFFTQVIIDGSNILAKVFYNQITPVKQDGTAIGPGEQGQKSVTVGLVKNVNPFEIMGTADVSNDIGNFIFITVLCITLLCFMISIFLSIALLFVGRVVALWLCMIFSPLAFASYTVSFEIPGFGHKEWWNELLKNAFLAPIFIFFLYIIIILSGFLNAIPTDIAKTGNWTDSVMKAIIPFGILFILLTQAKKLAVTYSGEMGKAMMSVAGKVAAVGGLALGAATGGVAMLATRTIGKGALGALEGEKGEQLRKQATEKGFSGWQARQKLRALEGASTSSFDVRKTAAGKQFSKATGMNLDSAKMIGLGPKEGGYAQRKEDKAAKKQKRAEKLKVGKDETLSKDLRKTESDLSGLLSANAKEIETVDKLIEKKRQEVSDANNKFNAAKGTPGEAAARLELTKKNNQLEDAKQRKTALRDGEDFSYIDDSGKMVDCEYSKTSRSTDINPATGKGYNIKELEEQKRNQVNDIDLENTKRLRAEADRLSNKGGTINEEAAYRIRTGAAQESKNH